MDYASLALAFICITLLRRFVRSFFPVYLLPDNKAVLITGCDTGFGYLLSLKAKKAGFFVFACCFSKSSDGASDLEKNGCHVLEVDVTKQEMIDAALEKVKDQLKEKKLSLHGIVNNAGINVTSGPMEWNSPETVEKVLTVNTMGVVRVTRSFLPLIRAAQGRIVNVCSMAAHVVGPRMIPYCMSKSATFVLSNGLRREMTAFGVKVATISPWFYSTNIIEEANMKRYAQNSWDGTSDDVRKAYAPGSKSFEEHYDKAPKKIPNLRNDLGEVIDCMMDALTNEQPKADYIPDLRSRIMACLFEVLPIHWVDYLIGVRKKIGGGILDDGM